MTDSVWDTIVVPELAEYRILWTSSRQLPDGLLGYVDGVLGRVWQQARCPQQVVVVHGDAPGGDQLVQVAATARGWRTEPHSLHGFRSARIRNEYMVELDANVCVAVATRWASGTGMCARMARRAGIPTLDYGVDTR